MSEKRVQRPYTDAETDILRTMFDEGLSDIRIAHTLGRTTGSVCARRAYVGLYRHAGLVDRPSRVSGIPAWSDAEIDQLKSLVDAGRNDHEIGTALGRLPATVGARRRKLGLKSPIPPGRPRSYDTAKIDAARARIASGVRVADVAADLGLKPRALYWRLRIDHAPSA